MPIAPTRWLALAALETLRSHGVIAVSWPQATWDANPAARVTIRSVPVGANLAGLSNRAAASSPEDYLENVDRGEMAMGARLRLWTDLVCAEAESLLEQQLTKHRLPREWAADMPLLQRKHILTLAQWRSCAWAAVRCGASCAQQVGGLDEVRDLPAPRCPRNRQQPPLLRCQARLLGFRKINLPSRNYHHHKGETRKPEAPFIIRKYQNQKHHEDR